MKQHDDDAYDLMIDVLLNNKLFLLTEEDKNLLEDYHYIFAPLQKNTRDHMEDVATLIHNYRNDQLGKKIINTLTPQKQSNKSIKEDTEALQKHAIFLIKHMGFSKEANVLREHLRKLVKDTSIFVYKKPKLSASQNQLKEYLKNLHLKNYSTDIQDFLKKLK